MGGAAHLKPAGVLAPWGSKTVHKVESGLWKRIQLYDHKTNKKTHYLFCHAGFNYKSHFFLVTFLLMQICFTGMLNFRLQSSSVRIDLEMGETKSLIGFSHRDRFRSLFSSGPNRWASLDMSSPGA